MVKKSQHIFPGKSKFNDILENRKNLKFLILHNDDFHSFDFVIDSLMEVCKHDSVQAEQCTFIVHYKGKCEIKKGSLKELRSLKQQLAEKGLTATIE